MGAARPETAGTAYGLAELLQRIPTLNPWAFGVLFAAFFFSPYWLIVNLVHTLWWDPPALVSADGVNLGRDFVAFYSAADLTLNGEAARAYDHGAIHAAQREAIGAPVKFFPWFYPPFMQMFIAPLALLPYLAAFAVWVLAPLAALLFVVRRHAGHAWASAAMFVFPGTAQSVLAGQNGVLSALIIAGGLLNLERRPVIAGAILGLLSYKPHIAATVFAALLVGRQWRALAMAIGVALSLAVVSLIVLGPEPWFAFFRESTTARTFTENGSLNWSFMATTFATARLAGLSVPVAYALQALVACGALLALVLVWSRRTPLDQRAAVLVTVIPLVTPYAFNYDLAVVGLALVWLARMGLEAGLRRDELVVFALAWVVPAMGWVIADATNVLLTPIVLVALLGVLIRRVLIGDPAAALKPL